MIAGIPTLFYAFRDFDAFMFNTLYYFESQTEFRDSAEGAVGNFAMTLREKLVFAHDWWATGPNVVIMAFATAALVTVVMVPGFRHDPAGFFRPPLVLAILAFVAAFVMSFQVTPMWPGYLIPPIVMAIVLGAAAFGMLDARVRRSALPLLVAAALVAVITMSPARFVVNLPKLFERDQWTGVLVHRGAQELGRHMRAAGFADPATQIASVAPILVLEAGFSIFNELSAGPFFYRSGNFMSPEQRARFNVLSVDTADAFLRERRPAAILVGAYDPTRPDYFLEVPFIRFAEEAGYHRVDLGPVPGGNILYLRPPDLGDAVATDDRGWPGTP
ncbi:MAG: hypothetical protein EA406_05290 [Rhodospirillales bacterium]|nr:MAG: hypothetical protein EA406_05290 [Rhodospirillales bacterium]